MSEARRGREHDPVTLFFGACRALRFVLSPEDSHHAVRVLRHHAADRVSCIDGTGAVFEVELDTLDPRAAAGEIRSVLHGYHEPYGRIRLVCGAAGPSRMDWLVEKATELGVHEILPVRGSLAPGPGRVRRWSRIARGAAKQCRRGFVPLVHEPAPLEEHLMALPGGGLRIWAEAGGGPLPGAGQRLDSVVLAVGHDNGFNDSEKLILREAGFLPVDLGPRRLRTETAVMVLLSWLANSDPVARQG